MSSVIKGAILRQDQAVYDGVDKNATRKDSGGGTVTGLKIGWEVDVLMAYGNGESYTRQTIADCVARIGSAQATLVFNPGTWVIDADLTIGSNFACRVPAGCVFQVASGKTLTFNGPVYRDSNTWTSGSGTVTESGTRYIAGKIDLSGAVLQGGTPLVFEGASDNAFETSIIITDPTADRTITFPDSNLDLSSIPTANGSNTYTGSNTFSGTVIVSGTITGTLPMPTNLRLTASVGSSALTIALKGNDGNDPSASNPVYVPFRNVTGGTGDTTWLAITAATSIVVSSGSTLGTTSGVASRVWVVGFNDGGTFRLGVMQCSSAGRIYSINDAALVSSTAEGGAGAADSAGVIYTGTAVTSKALRVLGFVESTQATAGTWATTPSKVQLWTPAMKLPGDLVQVSHSGSATFSTGTTALPDDNTIPQNTEGDQYLTTSITPTSAINRLYITIAVYARHSANAYFSIALFQDSTANALAATKVPSDSSNSRLGVLFYEMIAGTGSSTTFNVRAGGAGGATLTFNGEGGASFFGGAVYSFIRVEEVMV